MCECLGSLSGSKQYGLPGARHVAARLAGSRSECVEYRRHAITPASMQSVRVVPSRVAPLVPLPELALIIDRVYILYYM